MGKSSGSAKVQVNEYYMSVHMGICLGRLDALRSIYIGEKLAWSGDAGPVQEVSFDQFTDLQGGTLTGGGLNSLAIDWANGYAYRMDNGDPDRGLRRYNIDTLAEDLQVPAADMGLTVEVAPYTISATLFAAPDGSLVFNSEGSNTDQRPIVRLRPSDYTEEGRFGASSGSSAMTTTAFPALKRGACCFARVLSGGGSEDYFVAVTKGHEVGVLKLPTMEYVWDQVTAAEDFPAAVGGVHAAVEGARSGGSTEVFLLCGPGGLWTGGSSSDMEIWRLTIANGAEHQEDGGEHTFFGINLEYLDTLSVADFVPGAATLEAVTHPVYDESDGGLIMIAQDGASAEWVISKWREGAGIVWQTSLGGGPQIGANFSSAWGVQQSRVEGETYAFMQGTTSKVVNASTGAVIDTTESWAVAPERTQVYDEASHSIIFESFDSLYRLQLPIVGQTATSEGTITIDRKNLFGGPKKEGGVAGDVHFMPGDPPGSVTLLNTLAQRLGLTSDTAPAYAGLANLFFVGSVAKSNGGFMWGANSPYLKTVWAKVFRRSNTFGAKLGEPSNYADMGDDANPAHMIYECLTDSEWGMGAPADIIDVGTFQDCAKTFHDEDFGLSMMWVQQATIEDFVTEILDHVQATLFVNPRTGLLTLKAIRDDYDPETLPVLDADNCTVTKFDRKAWGETVNEINVTWTNPANEQEQTVTIHDLANIEMQGGIVSDTRNYYGVRNANLAMRIAARDLRSAAAPLASVEIEADRAAWDLLPGGVFKLNYPELGISGLVLRIGNINYGRPGESTIKISTIEDIFSEPQSSFVTPDDTGWEDPSSDPTELDYVQIMTLPTFLTGPAVSLFGQPEPEYPEVLAGVLGATTNTDTASYDLYAEVTLATGETVLENIGAKPPMSRTVLAEEISAEAETTLTGAALGVPGATVGEGPVNAGFVMFGEDGDTNNEIAIIGSIDGDNSFLTLLRGVLDTVPRDWPTGTPVWFLGTEVEWAANAVYSDGSDVLFRTPTSTSQGGMDVSDAQDRTGTMSGRPHYPLRPANVQINGQGYGEVSADTEVDLTVTWANRNRLTEDSQIVRWDEADVTPESGQTTTVTVMDVDRNVLNTHTGLSGTSFTLPYASFSGESAGIVKVTSERDGFESLQGHEIAVRFLTGYGNNYGNSYGAA